MKKEEYFAIDEDTRKISVLEGDAYYSCIHFPNRSAEKKFKANPFFVVNLVPKNAANKKKGEALGLILKESTETIPKPYFQIKRVVYKQEKIDTYKPSIVDSLQNDVPEEILIGNGSSVRLKFGTWWNDYGTEGVQTSLYKVQILNLVPFVPNKTDPDMEMDGEGFTIEVAANESESSESEEASVEDIFDED